MRSDERGGISDMSEEEDDNGDETHR